MNTWLFLGSSPNVAQHYGFVCTRLGSITSITCNSGIYFIRRPDYYLRVDHPNIHPMVVALAEEAKMKGTITVSVQGLNHTCKHYDVHLNLPKKAKPERDVYGSFTYSGLMCMQFALIHGAERMILVGCEGYRWRKCSHFDEGKPYLKSNLSTDRVIRAGTEAICQAWDPVPFYCIGKPYYKIVSQNWHVVDLGGL